MKKVFLLFAFFSFFTVVTKAQTASTADFKFENETHNFGKILLGKPVTHNFTFTNVGEEPLILTNVQASCGCTVPEFTKVPVKKGEKGSIKVTFNAAAGPAPFSKSLTITSNAKTPMKIIYIKGETINP
ncbi:MAG: DUF1573 domain-containing protein [Sphingobacteriaceae bacterium]|nr:DUF1573 domain-containing protein [Sphingobacteriaceae bacterium]